LSEGSLEWGPPRVGPLEWGPIEWVPTPTQEIPLGGLPHKNRGFFEWELTCVGAPLGCGPL
jgi:hypothetical protein